MDEEAADRVDRRRTRMVLALVAAVTVGAGAVGATQLVRGGAAGADANAGAAGDAPTATDHIHQCLTDWGSDVGRAGEVDGELGAELDLNGHDLLPGSNEAMTECVAGAKRLFWTPTADDELTENERRELDLHVSTFLSCMEDAGFHRPRGEPGPGDLSSEGVVIIEFPDGEDERPDFNAANDRCAIEAIETVAPGTFTD